MKTLKYFYAFLWLFIIPVVIGLSVENFLIKIYNNFNKHLLAGLVVCLLNSLAVSWIPGGFLINGFNIREKHDFVILTLLLSIAGLVTPLIAGFESFGTAVTVLLILSALLTMDIVKKEMHEISERLQYSKE